MNFLYDAHMNLYFQPENIVSSTLILVELVQLYKPNKNECIHFQEKGKNFVFSIFLRIWLKKSENI